MDRDSVLARVRNVVVENLGADEAEVLETASFTNDLGADSLDTVELVMALEEEFKVQIPDADAENVKTVGQAVDYVLAHGGK